MEKKSNNKKMKDAKIEERNSFGIMYDMLLFLMILNAIVIFDTDVGQSIWTTYGDDTFIVSVFDNLFRFRVLFDEFNVIRCSWSSSSIS